jgi:hypothetical protein
MALRAVAAALAVLGEDVEVVVHDSSDLPTLGGMLSVGTTDPRLRYRYSVPPVSFADAFNKGVEYSSGEYVCLIGDDDGVLPGMREAAVWARKEGIDAVSPTGVASYFWPDFRSRYYGGHHAGRLYLKAFTGSMNFPDPDVGVYKCLHSGGSFCEDFHLPKVYLALVRRSCLDAIREKSGGDMFRGASPDLYGALALAFERPRYAEVDYPLVVGGNSGRSAAGLSATRRHVGELDSVPLLRQFQALHWPAEIPAFYSVETVWGLAALLAVHSSDRASSLLEEYNFGRLCARCLLAHPDYASRVLKSVKHGGTRVAMRALTSAPILVGQSLLKLTRRLRHPGPAAGATALGPFQAIDNATAALTELLSRQDRPAYLRTVHS